MSFFGRNYSDDYDINKIKVGMTKEEVRNIFGRPKKITSSSSVGENWTYWIMWHVWASIGFDKDNKVSSTYRSQE